MAPAAFERMRLALRVYAETIHRHGARRIRMVATRDARYRDEFVALVRAELGVVPELISGTDESILSFRPKEDLVRRDPIADG